MWRKRLISNSDYNLSLDAPKSILETEKTLKTLSSGQKLKKPKKNKKKQKNPLGWFFYIKTPGFFKPCLLVVVLQNIHG
jgi:hypothetical protein